MQSLAIYLYITAFGFAAAGVLSSFVHLVSGRPLHFGIEQRSVLGSIGAVLLRMLAGPAILMRNAWARLREDRSQPAIWFGLSAAIAAMWSLLSGAI
ncbi:MAG TPA: hypothetical protein VNJ31_11910, partial [Methyloceanibacter sp.]|nr:hypothetical protein [Methyloceanibacter sp.]